ncbi:uncharacterized protein [Phocoena phocoena]|uniref:uncharacterized protein n=1 Tax=Phocoena phocoena TaxID=9742 RepID=UPI0033075CF3
MRKQPKWPPKAARLRTGPVHPGRRSCPCTGAPGATSQLRQIPAYKLPVQVPPARKHPEIRGSFPSRERHRDGRPPSTYLCPGVTSESVLHPPPLPRTPGRHPQPSHRPRSVSDGRARAPSPQKTPFPQGSCPRPSRPTASGRLGFARFGPDRPRPRPATPGHAPATPHPGSAPPPPPLRSVLSQFQRTYDSPSSTPPDTSRPSPSPEPSLPTSLCPVRYFRSRPPARHLVGR